MTPFPPMCRPVDYIIERTAECFEVPKEIIVNKGKRGKYVAARQVAMMLAREMLPHVSLTSLAKVFRRDHSTVHHGITRGQSLILGDSEIAAKARQLREQLVADLQVAEKVRDQVLANMLSEALFVAKNCPQMIFSPADLPTGQQPTVEALSASPAVWAGDQSGGDRE